MIGIVISILVLGFNGITHGSLTDRWATFVYWGEALGLWSFALSWLTASHTMPVINRPDEKFNPLA